jgi:hypothetical protein
VFIVVVHFIIDAVWKLFDTPSNSPVHIDKIYLSKVKSKLPLCLIKLNVMKTALDEVVNFTIRMLYTGEKIPRYLLDRELSEPHDQKNPCHCQESNPVLKDRNHYLLYHYSSLSK